MASYPLLIFDELQADELCDYIQKKHHSFARHSTEMIHQYFVQMLHEATSETSFVNEMHSHFLNLQNHLEQHLKKEETVLFPFIRKMIHLKNGEGQGCFPLGAKVENPLRIMSHEHEKMIHDLEKINIACSTFLASHQHSITAKLCYVELMDLEEDLRKHFSLEEEILHPKLIELGKLIQENLVH